MEAKERYAELCRLCASYDAIKMDIFGQEGQSRRLVDKIQTCLPFKIAENDRLPKCLCYRCMYNLENFYDFRTACVNAVALLERYLPACQDGTGDPMQKHSDQFTQLRSDHLKEKENMPILIPEAPIVNPNGALGTPPRLNSDGEADHEIEEILDQGISDGGGDDPDDQRSDEYEMDMETNPSDFLEMTSMVTDDIDDNETINLTANTGESALFQHTLEQHEVYVCSLCNKAFSSKGHLSLHARIHVGAGDIVGEKVITDDHTSYKRPYQCDLCNKSYSTAKHRWGHVSTTHRGHPAVTCRYCSRIYSTRTNLEEHIKSRHAGLPPPPEIPLPYIQQDNKFQCKTCPKMYTNITDLNKHSRVCVGDRKKEVPPKIPIQKNKGIIDTSDLSSMDTDDESKDYRNAEAKLAKNPQLTILKQALTKKDNLAKDHKDGRTNEKRKKSSPSDNNETDGQKRWYCETCPQSFISVDHLKEHEYTHDADKPFFCILCEKDFMLKSSLSRHIIASHGVDPSPIINSDKCLKKSLAQKLQNINPENSANESNKDISESPLSPTGNHANKTEYDSSPENMIEIETVFVCEICTRDFNDRASLWLHIRATHKEFAAFACGVCLKICVDNMQLLNHVNMYHGGSKLQVSEQRRYSCTICGRQHDSRKKLITHVSIHNVDPSYDPASFVQLNSNYYNENLNSNEANDQTCEFDGDEIEKMDCYICYKSFPSEDHLIRHQRNAHKSEPLAPIGEPTGNGTGSVSGNGNRAQYHLFFVCELCGSSHPSKWERWLHVSNVHSNEPAIRCERETCGKIFATRSLCNDHVQHHAAQGASPNTCEICGKLWGSRVDYWKHVMGVHSDTVPLICGVCLKVFPDVRQLSAHVKANHWPLTNGDFSCDICGRPYSNKSKMSRHRKIHGMDADNYMNSNVNDSFNNTLKINHAISKSDLTCEMCDTMKFSNLEDLCNHRRNIHGLFPCDLCNKCYGRTSHLWKHVNRVHKGHPDVTCQYCLKTSASKEHLAAHIAKIHRYEPENKREPRNSAENFKDSSNPDNEIPHHCEKCNKGFHKRYLLRRHMKGCQNYRKDPGALLTRCRACERIFKDRASLQKHIENHHSTYTCHLCNESIMSKLGIMTHNRVNHMNHPDLTCEHSNCKKLFRTKEDLESHKVDHKYHTSLNICDFCGDTVENKLKLKMHILSLHRNEIGVSCGVCLIPMTDPKDLKRHVEEVHNHILSKPNTCQVCGKKYASKWKAFDHTKKCHGKVFKTCKQCLAVFTEDDQLKNHYADVHNVPKDQLAAFDYRLDSVGTTLEDYESADLIVKEELEDMDFNEDAYHVTTNENKRKRSINDTFDCDLCPEIFLNDQTLSQHYRNVHNKNPVKMLKKMKLEMNGSKKKIKNRPNFECKNCGKQFCTKTLFWNHINTCKRRSSIDKEIDNSTFTSILEAHLKNNNQIKIEESIPVTKETNLNIPDFNLFEDINMQLSGQKPVPDLMPISMIKGNSNSKCSRKDSRKVYDELTNTVCACEVCGKPWPAKKHLWQHLIRFHRAEAAVTCGVCLKLCNTYEDLANHLKKMHEAILTREGNNFTCKTCGRYHNARSKLLLHMSIHINYKGKLWCQRCHERFDDEDKLSEHSVNCTGKQDEYDDHSNDLNVNSQNDNDNEEKTSVVDDDHSRVDDVEVDFESGAEVEGEDEAVLNNDRSHSDNSDSEATPQSTDSENDIEDEGEEDDAEEDEHDIDDYSRTNSRVSEDASNNSESEDNSEPESGDDDVDEHGTTDINNMKTVNEENLDSDNNESNVSENVSDVNVTDSQISLVNIKAEANINVNVTTSKKSNSKKIDHSWNETQSATKVGNELRAEPVIKTECQELCELQNEMLTKVESVDFSDDEGPPILSPMVPLVLSDMNDSGSNAVHHSLSPIIQHSPRIKIETSSSESNKTQNEAPKGESLSSQSNTRESGSSERTVQDLKKTESAAIIQSQTDNDCLVEQIEKEADDVSREDEKKISDNTDCISVEDHDATEMEDGVSTSENHVLENEDRFSANEGEIFANLDEASENEDVENDDTSENDDNISENADHVSRDEGNCFEHEAEEPETEYEDDESVIDENDDGDVGQMCEEQTEENNFVEIGESVGIIQQMYEDDSDVEMEGMEIVNTNGVEIPNLDGAVLMVANDADGNQILIQHNVSDMTNDDSNPEVTEFILSDATGYEIENYEMTSNDEDVTHQSDDVAETSDEENTINASENVEEISNISAKCKVSRT